MPDLVLINAGELVTCWGSGDTAEDQLGVIEDGALVVDGGKVAWAGTARELKRKSLGKPRRTVDAEGSLVTPGFVDPHTHLVFAGTREDELERKTAGESYTSILASGGGILRTMRETTSASVSKIASQSRGRLAQLLRNGVTTAEVKTGYGLDLKGETKMLEAIGLLRKSSSVELIPTFLGLHAKPPRFGAAAEFTDYVVEKVLPGVAKARTKADFADCFCEEGAFSRDECIRFLQAAKAYGFKLKVHADEFTDSGGASMAAELGCTSADHLGKSGQSGVQELARRGVVAVLLPGTSLCSNIPYADAAGMTSARCTVALGTDLSPNSWIESPQMVMSLACNGMRMTPAQALLGFTRNAARAVSREDLGSLGPGSAADFVLHSFPGHRFLPYRVGGSYVKMVFKRGKEIFSTMGG